MVSTRQLKIMTCVVFLFLANMAIAEGTALTIYHRPGSAGLSDFSLKVVTVDGELCYEQEKIAQTTQRLKIKTSEMRCKNTANFAVFGKSNYFGGYKYVSDIYPKKGGACTVYHDKDGWVFTKLRIQCSDNDEPV